jgi:hypothetical protein
MSPSFLTCQHLHPTGKRCGSPALRDENFCFFHHPTHRPPARARAAGIPFEVPPIVNCEDFQVAISEVLRRLADNTLDIRRGRALLAGLQAAKANLPNLP